MYVDAANDSDKHPLFNLTEFQKLQTLVLTLPISLRSGPAQYDELWLDPIRYKQGSSCPNLTFVCLNFDHWNANRHHLTNTINNIWNYVLSLTPSLKHYSSNVDYEGYTSILSEWHRLNHLVGHFDKLHSLTLPSPQMLQHITSNIVSLSKLEISSYSSETFKVLIGRIHHLKYFPNLTSFAVIYKEGTSRCYYGSDGEVHNNMNESAAHFLEYLLQEKPSKLQFVTLLHEKAARIGRNLAKHPSYSKEFGVEEDTSLKICKLIIALATSTDMKIKTITLPPVILRKKELEYLEFWFGDGFGAINKNIYSTKQGSINLIDITITNRQE